MLLIHERLAELWTIKKRRELTKEEEDEMALCLEANATFVWNMFKLQNLSLLASATADHEWQHEICRQIEKMERQLGIQPKI
jgi:hypothetical protein